MIFHIINTETGGEERCDECFGNFFIKPKQKKKILQHKHIKQ